MPESLLLKLYSENLIDHFEDQIKRTIAMNADWEDLPLSTLEITGISTKEIDFKFLIGIKAFKCSITWQKFLANQAFVNNLKFN